MTYMSNETINQARRGTESEMQEDNRPSAHDAFYIFCLLVSHSLCHQKSASAYLI